MSKKDRNGKEDQQKEVQLPAELRQALAAIQASAERAPQDIKLVSDARSDVLISLAQTLNVVATVAGQLGEYAVSAPNFTISETRETIE